MTDNEALEDFEYTLTRRALRQIKAEAWDEGRAASGPIWCLACDQEATEVVCESEHQLTIRPATNPYLTCVIPPGVTR